MIDLISRLFDYGKFESHDRLNRLIKETESRHLTKRKELKPEELDMVNAAGEIHRKFTGEE